MPDELKRDYEEARRIVRASPRGAAALLRLVAQKLLIHLGYPGKNLDDDIAALVHNGLDTKIQKALDVVRVIGNNAVHPGKLDIADDTNTCGTLFDLMNLIVDDQISKPKRVDEIYQSLPSGALKHIAERDKTTSP